MKTIIFDMDGTIIDSSIAIEKTVNEVREQMNLAPLEVDFIIKAINEPGRNLGLDFYGIDRPSASLKEGFEEKFKKYYDLYAVCYNGIDELLNLCKNENFKVVLASNAPQNTLEAILKKCEIYEIFDEIIGASEYIPQKPDPTMLLLACERVGASRAMFVGDSMKDELAAKNAKMPYMQVSWGFGKKSQSAEFNASSIKEAWALISEF
ncbi:HAD family hydrolase [Campylobacter sp. RM13119]|uniref:HAD family hydrolase n=1 Tax=Campylobacter californiensis TaxID=1032243 RepID=UPI001472E29B|nr:HAD family hydrolase [Campylobacter sp. RM13119]MBE3605465.1 HAD family hydrolase [Campylobacter sp. RM13119]